ncbi:3-hydroxy-3-methylglutaryl-coenzyme A reductase [Nilaparvata lugens]|uniref:3-hydroxy-3-methylglutaryl-coenzyme A reductase n=1 Tax=Nilaparvata lugens TaxID=108931 RepID=UPI00193E43E6|nr:3-hydroxy-3-methylglutaryl-coenzyme A reductase [Nilaparvata lugens]
MLVRLFRRHGEFCASHPWEVIVGTLTLTACILSLDDPSNPNPNSSPKPSSTPSTTSSPSCGGLHRPCLGIEVITVFFRFVAGIAGLFTVFSSFVFTSSVINFMRSDISDLKDALFFFLLLIDLSKATVLAQYALSSSSRDEVKHNIARGMALLGPTITLDTIVETLVISVGTLSGVKRLEVLCWFACLSVVVNYVVFMTFYPACLSLILELSRSEEAGHPAWHNKSLIMRALKEEDQKPNPVVQRVKMIMSAGLVIVHLHSRLALRNIDRQEPELPLVQGDHISSNRTEDAVLQGYLMRWVRVSADQIVILILLLALTVKFIFFEDKEELAEQILMSADDAAAERNLDSTMLSRFMPTGLSLVLDSASLDSKQPLQSATVSCLHKRVQTETDLSSPRLDKLVETDLLAAPRLDKLVQTDGEAREVAPAVGEAGDAADAQCRTFEECAAVYKADGSACKLNDAEVCLLVKKGLIAGYQLEKVVNDCERGVGLRRKIVCLDAAIPEALNDLPYKNYDYDKVMGVCCENVIGYVPVPVGVAGPLRLDDQLLHIPMATTEGCLVASTNRGCRALKDCGVRSRVVADGMTRGPVVRFQSITRASEAMMWMQLDDNFRKMKEHFDQTSRYARLSKVNVRIAGRHLFIRFVATTGDAMGMNMVSKGTEHALKFVQSIFNDMEILSLSGNFCADKKPAAVNWIEGRGKSVVCEAIIPSKVVLTVLKTSVQALVDVNISKNMIGSAVAGSIGGFNAHAANIVTAIYIATGQDPAQNVSSSNCMTLMEPWGREGNDLYVSCTMPSIEIGTIGGGTQLPAQASCLDMLGVRGPNETCPGENANKLARIVCGTVLAGELSLMSALAAGHLVRSHLRHNRSSTTISNAAAAFPGFELRSMSMPCQLPSDCT